MIILQMNNWQNANWPIEHFNAEVDAQSLRREWEEWHRSFELVMEMRNIRKQHQKYVLLLALGGRGLQRVYDSLGRAPDEIHPEPVCVPYRPVVEPEYDNAVKRLKRHFVGKTNERVELEVFRALEQTRDESFNHFLLKLRTQASRCGFGDRQNIEIFQQIAVTARDERVRDKGIEGAMTLDELTNYAINREVLMQQKEKRRPFREMPPETVAAVSGGWKRRPTTNKLKPRTSYNARYSPRPLASECISCGSRYHQTGNQACNARNAKCNNCDEIGHFARKCKENSGAQRAYRGKPRNRSTAEANSLHSDNDLEELPRRPKREDTSQV